MKKGVIGFLLGGGILGIITLIIALVISWWLTTSFCVLCEFLNPVFKQFGMEALPWWIQFLITVVIVKKVFRVFGA